MFSGFARFPVRNNKINKSFKGEEQNEKGIYHAQNRR